MASRARRAPSSEQANPDMTAMIDISFQLITFFIMVMTMAKDEAAQRIRLPIARTAAILQDDQIPDSLNINVAYLAADGERRPTLLSWGLELDLRQQANWDRFRKLIRNEAAIQKMRQQQQGSDWKKEGLSTTIIIRVDQDVEYTVFRQVMDQCREAGFTKFQLKAASEEEKNRGQAG